MRGEISSSLAREMRVALIYPPTCDPTAPYLAVPTLTGFLRAHGVEVMPIDANVEAFDRLLRPEPLAELAARVEQRLRDLDGRASLGHADQLAYAALFRALGDARAVPGGIAEAVAILRDPVRFFDAELYARAVDTIDAALRVISAAYHPLRLDFTAYRTPFALLTPEEIAHDAAPERDPFDGYIRDDLVPRLRAAPSRRDRVVGLLSRAAAAGVRVRSQAQAGAAGGAPDDRRSGDHAAADSPARAGPGARARAVRFGGRVRGRAHAAGAGARARAGGARGARDQLARVFAGVPNVVHRDRLMGAKFLPGHSSEDMRVLPAPDFDGLALDKYFAPQLVLPYDPTRGCYWGKCTFCHYGLAEVGTATYRERAVDAVVGHLRALSQRYGTRHFYFSQDSVAPKTLLKLSSALAEADLGLAWATDLKPEKYLTPERAEVLRRGGAVACALGVESASPRVLDLIDKGAPVEVVGDVIDRLDAAGIAVEAMCFTGFPTETADEALQTVSFLDDRRERVAAFIVGEFDLTHGALVAQDPERFGIDQVWQVEGDQLGTGLFYEEAVAVEDRRRSGARRRRARRAGVGMAPAPLPVGGIALDRAHGVLLRALRQGRAALAGAAGRGRRDWRARGDGGRALRSGGGARRRGGRGRHLARAGARAPRGLARGVPGTGGAAAVAAPARASLSPARRCVADRGRARARRATRGRRSSNRMNDLR